MSGPLVPSPLDCIGVRRFALYPRFEHPDPNEWVLGTASRSEVEIVNAYTGRAIWIPRQHISAVSESQGSSLVVGLTQVLDCKGLTAEPRVKRVIEMPASREQRDPEDIEHGGDRRARPAPVIAIRLESKSDSGVTKAMIAACTGAIVVALLAALLGAAKF